MALVPGSRIGAYEILSPLGAGGMGEVYRAKDSKLKREVALKVLPAEIARDAERVARFQREAELLASLNHPHIAQIYGFETGEPSALVLELVDGETLADRLARGPIPGGEALPLARQIAEALDYAHEHGVLHRDLKPANIKVTTDGQVKVLDFGLAKALEPAGIGDRGAAVQSNSPTITSPAMTRAGVILGTAAYMSPEQARGKRVDKRTDVWAFGCVLYEMLTARRAFAGETVTDVLGAILHKEPDWLQLPAATSSSVRRLLERALTKDPSKRLRDIGDASLLLDGVPEVAAPHAPPRTWLQPVPVLIATLMIAGLAAFGGWLLRTVPVAGALPAMHLTIDPPADAPISNRGGLDLAISRDGRRVAFLADGPNGRQLYVRDLDAETARPLPGTENSDDPFFSWDGRWIGFESRTESKLMRVSVDGGTPQAIPGAASQTRGATWGPDDRIIYAGRSALWRVPVAGGTPETLLTGDAVLGLTSRLFDDKAIVFDRVTPSREIVALNLQTHQQKVLLQGTGAVYVSSGHLVFAREGNLMAVGFDVDRLVTIGDPVTLVEHLRVSPQAATDFAASDTGTLVYLTGDSAEIERPLHWIDRDGRTSPLTTRRTGSAARLSPDGRWLAIAGGGALWTVDLVRGSENRVAGDVSGYGFAWTPDSRRITFVRRIENGTAIESVDADGGALPVRLRTSPTSEAVGSWSPDGKTLALRTNGASGSRDLAFLDAGASAIRDTTNTPFDEGPGCFSPGGRLLAYVSEESGRPQVYVRGYPAGSRLTVSTGGGQAPVWSPDGRTLFFAGPVTGGLSSLMAVTIDPSSDPPKAGVPTVVLPGPYRLSDTGGLALYDVSPDGKRFVMIQPEAAGGVSGDRIHVILNWEAMLRGRIR